MMRRVLMVLMALLLGVTLATAVAGSANAQTVGDDNYAALCSLTVNPPSAHAGDTVNVSGTSATPNATILIFLNSTQIGSTTSGADRSFSVDVVLPADATTGSISAKQVGDSTDPFVGCTNVAGLTIVAPATVTPEVTPLARTGSNSTMPLARLGIGLLAAGGLALLVAKRRRSAASA